MNASGRPTARTREPRPASPALPRGLRPRYTRPLLAATLASGPPPLESHQALAPRSSPASTRVHTRAPPLGTLSTARRVRCTSAEHVRTFCVCSRCLPSLFASAVYLRGLPPWSATPSCPRTRARRRAATSSSIPNQTDSSEPATVVAPTRTQVNSLVADRPQALARARNASVRAENLRTTTRAASPRASIESLHRCHRTRASHVAADAHTAPRPKPILYAPLPHTGQ